MPAVNDLSRYEAKKFTPLPVQEMAQLYNGGVTCESIGKLIGLTRQGVHFQIQKYYPGLIPQVREYKKQKRKKIISDLYSSNPDMSLDDLSTITGIGYDWIVSFMPEIKEKINDNKKKKIQLQKEEIRRLIDEENISSLRELARRVDIKESTLGGWLKRYDESTLRIVSRRPTTIQMEKRFSRLKQLAKENPTWSVKELADKMGLRRATLYQWLRSNPNKRRKIGI